MAFKLTLTEVGVKACALKLAYLKTIQAIFKIIELIIAIAIISTVVTYFNYQRVTGDLFFLSIIITFFICIFSLFISEWIVWSAVESNSKSMFEIVFFIVSSILLLASSINLFINVFDFYEQYRGIYIAYTIMSVLDCLLVGLYTTDIVLNLCLNCCRTKSDTKSDGFDKN